MGADGVQHSPDLGRFAGDGVHLGFGLVEADPPAPEQRLDPIAFGLLVGQGVLQPATFLFVVGRLGEPFPELALGLGERFARIADKGRAVGPDGILDGRLLDLDSIATRPRI
ncbi:MAG TPA: hypothetical protein VHL09_07025, partial [Dehalococcoidia bacterium]|nr:hypothetical protein [Dehalococcoidia bacterium]